MKKIFALILVLVLTVSLAGCGKEEPINKSLSKGVIDGNVYTNEYIGLTFTKPDSWIYSTDEEISEIMGATYDLVDSSDYEAAVSNLVSVFDMMARDPETGNNANIVFENLSLSSSEDITVDEYIEISKANLTEALADFSFTFDNTETVTLGGVEFTKLKCNATYMGVMNMNQFMYCTKLGKYMVVISVTIVDGSDPSVIEDYFAPAE